MAEAQAAGAQPKAEEKKPAGGGAGKEKMRELAKTRSKKLVFNLMMVVVVMTVIGIGLSSIGMSVVFAFFSIGMLPGIVANITDNRPGRFASKSIAAFNLAGIFPSMAAILGSGSPNNTAIAILKNPDSWLLVYGLAGVGWVIVYLVPHITQIYLEIKATYTVNKMQNFQQKLIEEWGEEIKRG